MMAPLIPTKLQNPSNPKRRLQQAAYAGLALGLLLAGAMGAWLWTLHAEEVVLHAQWTALEARWGSVSAQLREATAGQSRLVTLLDRQKRVTQERAARGWAPVLRSVVAVAGTDIALEDIQAREKPKQPGVGELHISGIATGESPRSSADQFRVALEAKLGKGLVANAVLTQFALCDNGPDEPRNRTASRKAAFTIVADVGLANRGGARP